jgi:predicted nucleic acid-binding protein
MIPDDNWVIQCALTAKADRIVSGDKPLLQLKAVEGVNIVSPRDLVDEIGIVLD